MQEAIELLTTSPKYDGDPKEMLPSRLVLECSYLMHTRIADWDMRGYLQAESNPSTLFRSLKVVISQKYVPRRVRNHALAFYNRFTDRLGVRRLSILQNEMANELNKSLIEGNEQTGAQDRVIARQESTQKPLMNLEILPKSEDDSSSEEDAPTAKRKLENSQVEVGRPKRMHSRLANNEEVPFVRQQTPPRQTRRHGDDIPLTKNLEASFYFTNDTSRFKLNNDDQVLYTEAAHWFKTKIRRDTETTIQELRRERFREPWVHDLLYDRLKILRTGINPLTDENTYTSFWIASDFMALQTGVPGLISKGFINENHFTPSAWRRALSRGKNYSKGTNVDGYYLARDNCVDVIYENIGSPRCTDHTKHIEDKEKSFRNAADALLDRYYNSTGSFEIAKEYKVIIVIIFGPEVTLYTASIKGRNEYNISKVMQGKYHFTKDVYLANLLFHLKFCLSIKTIMDDNVDISARFGNSIESVQEEEQAHYHLDNMEALFYSMFQKFQSTTLSDPHLTSNDAPKTLNIYDELEEYYLTILDNANFFKFIETSEDSKYYNISIYPKSSTHPSTPNLSSNIHYSDKLKGQDQELVAATNMAIKALRPFDAAAHTIISTSDPETPHNEHILHLLNCTCRQITILKGILPPESTSKFPLIDTTTFVEQAKLSKAIRRAEHSQSRFQGHGNSCFQNRTDFSQTAATSATMQAATTQSQDSASQQYSTQTSARQGRGRGKTNQ
ncbi:hypothetical protein BGZ76_004901 [Entomortierella beljakovae]|nr:hypothetical protein BGZ76_004901 [Entomortierella beljakovae]